MLKDNLIKIENSYLGNTVASNDFLPAFYVIEPTNKCNISCIMCPNEKYNATEKGEMSWRLFTKVIDEIKEVAIVIQLYWMGEPFLHEGLFDMINYCKQHTGAKVILSTNGSLMNSKNSAELLKTYLDEIIISLDAYESQDIYSQIRNGGNISKINANVEEFIARNQRIGVILQFIDFFVNKTEKHKFIRKWTSENCKVRIQCLYSWANQFPELDKLSDNVENLAGCMRKPCADLWYKACIHWNGRISICCFDWKPAEVIGDISSDTVANIWHSRKIQLLRSNHRNLHFPETELCYGCNEWASIEEYESLYGLNFKDVR